MARDELLKTVFPGTTEMAQRMRALDWSATALGPVEQWPQSLRTSVSTCLDCAFPIVLWWGRDLTILYNDEYRPALGPQKHPSALGQPGATVWAEIWDVIEPMLQQVLQSGQATRSRDLLLHIDRGFPEEAYFSFSYSPIHAEDGTIGGIFCPVIETTEKVIGERRLRTLRDLAAKCKGVAREEDAYRAVAAVLSANPHDVPFALVYQIDGQSSSATLKVAAGVQPGDDAAPAHIELTGNDVWSLSTVASGGGDVELDHLPERFGRLPSGAWKTMPQRARVLPVLLPGQEQPVAILVAPVSPMRPLDDDYRTFFNLIATQIAAALADVRALEEERRRAEALAELDRAKTIFFSNVSHEFRTPLTLMTGPLEDLLGGGCGPLSVEASETLQLAYRNSLRLLRLVNTLLDFSRIEAGRIDASYEPVDLATLTAELASVFRSAIERAGLRLVVRCEPLPEPVYVDRDMWEKIVLNLLSNALKFTLTGEITLSLTWRGEQVELEVADTGVGIPEGDLPRMFERFHRVKHVRARTHEGTGIGLALVQELARLHGGKASVRSRLGEGTAFTISVRTGTAHLPQDRIGATHTLTPTDSGALSFVEEALRWLPDTEEGKHGEPEVLSTDCPAPVPAGPRAGRARVLLADDNADMRDYVSKLLSASYEVTTVPDGRAALACIEARMPDVVVADVMMPHVDGFALLAAIRSQPGRRSLPVILLSARAGEEARIEGLRAGADDYIVKPFSARELIARVDSQIALARLRQEADQKKDEFLALLSHELRNPLAPIRAALDVLRMQGDSAEVAARVRPMLERQVGHMVRLVDDLLDVSRITSGKIVLRRERTDLDALILQAVEAQRAAIDAKHLDLAVRLDASNAAVDVDPTRFVQVLSNVLHNAAKFTPAGGALTVTSAVDADLREVSVTVADSGRGISADALPRIFDLFVQGDGEAGSQGGLGIGLALARQLMQMHDGAIEALSDGVGKGSRFVMRLPLASCTSTPSRVSARGTPQSTTPAALSAPQ